jgi:uncharacterized protein YjhX (UPF0386 family)
MKIIYIVLIFAFSITANAQSNFNSDDTSVTRGDLEINNYEKDSTANVLVLYEFGNSYIDRKSFKLKTSIKKKIKIFNRNGFEKTTITIYLYNNSKSKEKISNISATTYNLENGNVTKTKLSKSEIFEEKYNENFTLVKFTFPNIKEGSVINYSYTIESPFIFKYKGWNFQDDIPKLFSVYRTSIPGNYEYNIKLVGYLKLLSQEQEIRKNCLESGGGSANCLETVYVMKNIPAFIEEDYMTVKENYLSRIEYELKVFRGFDGRVDNFTKSWKTVDKEFKTDQALGRQLRKSNAIKGLLDTSIENEEDLLKKATAIYKHVQDNYTWNEEYHIFKDVSVKDLIANKSGKVSEINILLHNLLETQGIDVKPVLLSTRKNGAVTKVFPVMTEFNYLIVQATINGTTYLLDATDKYLSFGEIPFRCLNEDGRLLDFKNTSSWIDIKPSRISTIHYRVDLNLEENETLSGKINTTASGYHALSLKKSYYANNEDYLKKYRNKYNTIEFVDHKVTSEDKMSFEFLEEFDIEYATENVGENLYIDPFLFKFFTENPFKLQERSYPIDFGYEDAYIYTFRINLDENYEVLEKPEDLKLILPNNKGLLIFTSKIQDNSILLYFKFNFTETIYNPEYYDSLKNFMSTIVNIQKNSLIVLKKT